MYVWVCFRYIESMVHFASIRHPAAILDDLHGKVLNEAYQISKSTVTESVSTTMQRYIFILYKNHKFKIKVFREEIRQIHLWC